MKRAFALAVAVACHLAAHASPVPAFLTGSWSTSASPNDDRGAHNDLYLEADGYGVIVFSTAAAPIAGDDKSSARVIMGFPLRSTFERVTLTLHPFLPNAKPGENAENLSQAVFTCRYEAVSSTLTCTDPDGKVSAMRRYSEKIPNEVTRMIEAVRAQAGKP
jgi:hypothetical protein